MISSNIMSNATNIAITNRAADEALQAQDFATEKVVNEWAAQLDCAEGSRAVYRRGLQQYFAWVSRTGRHLNAMTRADILQFREGLLNGTAAAKGQPLSSLTAAAYLTALRLFYSWLESMGRYPNIAADIKRPHRQARFERQNLWNNEAAALVQETAETGSLRDIAIINLLLRSALRCVEVSRANIGDLKQRGGKFILEVQGKGHTAKDNFVEVSGKTAAAIFAYLNAERKGAPASAPLFTAEPRNAGYLLAKAEAEGRADAAKDIKEGRMTTRTISGIAKKHLKAIGLQGREYTAHSLRHTCGCSIIELTGDYRAAQLALRHASPTTTQLYIYHMDAKQRLQAGIGDKIDSLY